MQPFNEYDLRQIIQGQREDLNNMIKSFSNDEIMGNDLSILADNCYEQLYIEPVVIGEEEFDKRTFSQTQIKQRIDPFLRDVYRKEFVDVDGYSMTFAFSYSGDSILFKSRASTFSLSGYPDIDLKNSYISFHYEVPLDKLKNEEDKEKIMVQLNQDLNSIKTGIQHANSDVESFNQTLKQEALTALEQAKKKIEQFYTATKLFEIPIKKTAFANTHIPVQRKIQPINKKYNSEPTYSISDSEYRDVLETIKHNCSTYERTPASYKSFHEEDIRNVLLASLNGIYHGNATGETFRNKGKTDICIECDNRAAFVAECKMWKGKSKISDDINQLDNYLTWRDCKTALIYFVRNKSFLSILDIVKETLMENEHMRQVKEINKNELECSYLSQSNLGQIVNIRVLLFNMYFG